MEQKNANSRQPRARSSGSQLREPSSSEGRLSSAHAPVSRSVSLCVPSCQSPQLGWRSLVRQRSPVLTTSKSPLLRRYIPSGRLHSVAQARDGKGRNFQLFSLAEGLHSKARHLLRKRLTNDSPTTLLTTVKKNRPVCCAFLPFSRPTALSSSHS